MDILSIKLERVTFYSLIRLSISLTLSAIVMPPLCNTYLYRIRIDMIRYKLDYQGNYLGLSGMLGRPEFALTKNVLQTIYRQV